MLSEDNINEIKKVVKEFFQKTSFEIDLQVLPLQEKTIPIEIKTPEPKILIGQNGQTLAEIQRLLKAVLRRQILEDFYIDIDVNDYKKKKIEYLKETAKDLADEVAISGRERVLPPMSSYERRIIHLTLAERKDIVVQSTGQEPDRRITIKPVFYS